MKINKDNMVITIESETGSRGEEIARKLSSMLNIPCFGKEILDVASEISGIPVKLLYRYDGRMVYAAYDLTAEDESKIKIPPSRDFVTAQIFACKKLAQRAPCILVDRHASAALAGNENRISIFIHSDFDARASVLAKERNLRTDRAKRELKKIDTAYRSYYKSYNKDWGNASNYSLCLNASGNEIDDVAAMVKSFIEKILVEDISPVEHKIAV